MFIIAICPLAVLLTQYFGDVSRFGGHASTLAVAMICIGCTAHQAWSANLFTTVSDMFPKKDRRIASSASARRQAASAASLSQLLPGFFTDHFKATSQTVYLIMFCHLRVELFNRVGA